MIPESERERLDKALRWLRSHLNRLKLERESAATRLAELDREIDRVTDEIGIAEQRRRGPQKG